MSRVEGTSAMNKGVIVVIAVFFGFWLFTDPHGLADFTQSTGDSLWGWTQELFTSVIEFVGDL